MRMLKLFFAVAVLVTMVGCGKSVITIATPADGQKFQIDQTSVIDVTLAENDYTDVSITFRGTERVPEFTWQPASGTQARAYRTQQVGGAIGGGFSQCTEQMPCTIIIIAQKGDYKDIRTINLYR